jgi:hypothetical protein
MATHSLGSPRCGCSSTVVCEVNVVLVVVVVVGYQGPKTETNILWNYEWAESYDQASDITTYSELRMKG